MKQLELKVTIKQSTKNGYPTDKWELISVPKDTTNKIASSMFCGGNSKAQVFYRFIKALGDKNIRYWSMLKDEGR